MSKYSYSDFTAVKIPFHLSFPQRTVRRYETNDATTPMLVEYLAENPTGIIQFRDELVGWLNSMDQDYEKAARPLVLELWKGAVNYEFARKSEGRDINIKSGTLTVVGGIQPSKLRRYVSEAYSAYEADGFLQRFLFTYPDPVRSRRKPTPEDLEQHRIGFAAANRTYRNLAKFDFGGDECADTGLRFKTLRFSGEAQRAADAWFDKTNADAEALYTVDDAFSAYLWKLPKSFYAIVLIYHCLERIPNGDVPDEVGIDTVVKAIAYTDVLVSHARRVFALGENRVFTLANSLIGKIKAGDLEQGFTLHQVVRKQWSGLTRKEIVTDVLELLEEYGYLTRLPANSGPGGGRPTTKYYFHSSLESNRDLDRELL